MFELARSRVGLGCCSLDHSFSSLLTESFWGFIEERLGWNGLGGETVSASFEVLEGLWDSIFGIGGRVGRQVDVSVNGYFGGRGRRRGKVCLGWKIERAWGFLLTERARACEGCRRERRRWIFLICYVGGGGCVHGILYRAALVLAVFLLFGLFGS